MPAHLLASHIWNTLSHGDVWGQVSTATGLELDSLKAVLEAILQYLPRRTAIDLPEREVVAGEEPQPHSPMEGVDVGQIARDVNLKEETVRRVLDRLLAAPAPNWGSVGKAASNG